VADVGLAWGAESFAGGQIGCAVAVRAGDEDLDFGHGILLLEKIPPGSGLGEWADYA